MKEFKTYQLALSLYKESRNLRIKNRVLNDQFKRASLSIVLNIAEGYGRGSSKDRRRFFIIAFGSLRETQCLLEILENQKLTLLADQLAGSLYRLCQNPGCVFPDNFSA